MPDPLPEKKKKPAASPKAAAKAAPSPVKKKKSLFKKILKFFLFFIFFTLVLIVGAGAVLQFFFPGDAIKPVVEEKLASKLKMPVKIGGIKFNLLQGLQVTNVHFGDTEKFFDVNELTLNYDLSNLFRGKLIVNKVVVDQPRLNLVSKNGVWNFQPLLGAEKKIQEPEPEQKGGESGFFLPFAIELKSLAVNNVAVSVNIDEKIIASFEGLTVTAAGKAGLSDVSADVRVTISAPKNSSSPHNLSFISHEDREINVQTLLAADLTLSADSLQSGRATGSVAFKNSSMKSGENLPAPDITMEFDASLQQQTANLKTFLLKIGESSGIDLAAKANNIFHDPEFHLQLRKANFDLDELLTIAGDLAPPMKAGGVVNVSGFETSGKLINNKPESLEVSGGKISLADISVSYPDAGTDVRGFNANIIFQGIELANLAPDKVQVAMDLTIKSAKVGGIDIQGTDMALEADLSLKAQTANLKSFLLKFAKHNEIDLAAQASNILGDPGFNLQLHKANFDLAELLAIAGKLAPPMKAAGVIKISGLETSGNLKNNQPENIEVSSGKISLAKVSATYPDADAEVTGINAEITLQGIKLAKLVPQEVKAVVDLQLQSAKVGDIEINGLDQKLNVTGEGPNLPQANFKFATDLKSAKYPHPDYGVIETSINVTGEGQGNFQEGNIDAFQVKYGVGKMLKGQASGNVKKFGKESFDIKYLMDVGLEEAKKFIPAKLMEKTGLEQLTGTAQVDANFKGQLDDKFMPVHTKGLAEVKLAGINLALKTPSVKLKGFSFEASLPAHYDVEKGIKIPDLKIKTAFDDLQAMDKWQVGAFSTVTALSLDQFVSLTGDAGSLPITLKTTIQTGAINSQEPKASIAGLKVELDTSSDIRSAKDISNVTLNGNVSLKNIAAMDMATIGEVIADFKLDVNDLSLTQTSAAVNVTVKSPILKMKGMEVGLKDVEFKSVSRQNLKDGNIDIDQISLKLADIMGLSAKGSLKEWGNKAFSLVSNVAPFQLNSVLEKLPQETRDNLKGMVMDGLISMDISAEGSIPKKEEMDKMDLPVTANGQFSLAGFNFSWPEQGIKIDDLNISQKLNVKENLLDFIGSISFGKVTYKDLFGDEGLIPQWDFHFAVENWNKFSIKKHHLAFKNKGFSESITGRVEGLKAFLNKKADLTLPELLKRLEVSISARNSLELGKALSMVKGLDAQGGFAAQLDLNMIPGQKIVADGSLEFDNFNAQYEKTANVKGLDGKFIFSKQVFLDRKLLAEQPETFSAASKGFFSQLRNFSNFKNIFRIGSAEFGPHKASNIGLDIFFKDNQLAVEKFLVDVLGGTIAGNLFLTQTKEGPALKFSTEFAAINFNKLMGEKVLAEDEEAEIDGSFQFGFQINQGADDERINLDQIRTKVSINRIGEEAFDRILLFLDPEESKPAIVDIRSKLKLASPHRVIISLENGNLSFQAWLKNKVMGGIIEAPELKRVPVTSLKQFKNILDQIQGLSRFQQVLNYLAAQGVEFDENGKMVLF